MANSKLNDATTTDWSAHTGLQAMLCEMRRQCSDALTTLDDVKAVASKVADEIRTKKGVVLYGMGGSHHMNRIVEPLYRAAGILCRSVIASDALFGGLVDHNAVSIFTSQSGESGEILELGAITCDGPQRATLSLTIWAIP